MTAHRPFGQAGDLIARVDAFVAEILAPNRARWDRSGLPREVWLEAGRRKLLSVDTPREFGGEGRSIRESFAIARRFAEFPFSVPAFEVHSDICVPYIANAGTAEMKSEWLPRAASGERVLALAITEPHAGSDLAAISTQAQPYAGGYRLSGEKAWITNGIHADAFLVLAKIADKADGRPRATMFLVPADRPGVGRGPAIELVGRRLSAVCDISFADVEVSARDIVGTMGGASRVVRAAFARERLISAATSIAALAGALDRVVAHTRGRRAFGGRLFDLQNTRFTLADVRTDILAGEALLEQALQLLEAGGLSDDLAAAAKLWITEAQGRGMDAMLQLCGAEGYRADGLIAASFVDHRAQRLLGGASEIMREIVARSLDRPS